MTSGWEQLNDHLALFENAAAIVANTVSVYDLTMEFDRFALEDPDSKDTIMADQQVLGWATSSVLDIMGEKGRQVSATTFALSQALKALPAETWYWDKDVCPLDAATGTPEWLIWSSNDGPCYVAQVASPELAAFIVAAHNALVSAPPVVSTSSPDAAAMATRSGTTTP